MPSGVAPCHCRRFLWILADYGVEMDATGCQFTVSRSTVAQVLRPSCRKSDRAQLSMLGGVGLPQEILEDAGSLLDFAYPRLLPNFLSDISFFGSQRTIGSAGTFWSTVA